MPTPLPAKACFRAALLIGCVAALAAQSAAERLPIKTYTSADGLGSQVNTLMRDSRGFLWFSTSDGLSRFDGSRFVTYQVGDKNSPPSVLQMLETQNGVYWIATTLGIYRFDSNSLLSNESRSSNRPILHAELAINMRVNAFLFKDSKGNLWVSGNGLYRLEEKDGKASLKKIEMNLPLNPDIQSVYDAICEGQDGSFWIATSWGLIRRLPDGRTIFYRAEGLNFDYLNDVVEDGTGRIWVGRASGVYVIKPESLDELARLGAVTVRQLDDLAQVQTPTTRARMPETSGEILKYTKVEGFARSDGKPLYKTADGHIWISTGDGLVEYDGQSFHSFTTAQGLPQGTYLMTEDTSGNLWLAPPGHGLVRLDRRGLTTYDLGSGLKTTSILAVGETHDGKLYVASEGFFLSQFGGTSFQTIRPQLPLNMITRYNSTAGFQDQTGEWWILTDEGLYRFAAAPSFRALARQRPLAIYTSRNGLSGDRAFHIFEDSKGDLWVSTWAPPGGLSRWNRATNRFYTFSAVEGFPAGKSVRSFAEDSSGNLWLGFFEGGIARYADGRFVEFTSADGVPNGSITALQVDRQERLWVACAQSGLSRLDELNASRPRFVSYTTDNGLASNNVRSLAEDLYGNIYAGTARGVDKLSRDTTNVKHYSLKDGLAGDYVNVAFRDRIGAMWFGTPGGLSRLMPQPEQETLAPQTWLGGLRIAGEERPLPALGSKEISNLELTHAQNNLQIDFFAIDFKEGENLRYQYILEGADKDWSAPTLQRTVNYANLAPGTYRFLVRAVNADGVASVQPASISFRLLPPFWQRWWFVTIVVLLVGGAVVALDRYRIAHARQLGAAREERLRELERVRKRIATDLHDDIGSSLTQISIMSEVAQRHVGDQESPITKPLSLIASASRELVDSMSDIVWAINPQRDRLGDLIYRMRRFASDTLTARDIDLRFSAPEADSDRQVGANVRREVFLIFKESVNNIAKHAGCTKVEIEVRFESDQLVLSLKDNGKGFDTGQRSDGHGLMSMTDRARGLGGHLVIQSQLGSGTTTTLQAPLVSSLSRF